MEHHERKLSTALAVGLGVVGGLIARCDISNPPSNEIEVIHDDGDSLAEELYDLVDDCYFEISKIMEQCLDGDIPDSNCTFKKGKEDFYRGYEDVTKFEFASGKNKAEYDENNGKIFSMECNAPDEYHDNQRLEIDVNNHSGGSIVKISDETSIVARVMDNNNRLKKIIACSVSSEQINCCNNDPYRRDPVHQGSLAFKKIREIDDILGKNVKELNQNISTWQRQKKPTKQKK